MSESLQKLLADEHAQGRLDSTGAFTLAVRRSQKILRRYQLADPSFYLLKLVQAAVAAGAPWMRISLRPFQVEALFPGSLSLKSVAAALAQQEAPVAARHLAVGVNAALGHAERVRLELWTGGQDEALEVTPDAVEVVEAGQPPSDLGGEGCRVLLSRPSVTHLVRLLPLAEHHAIHARCRYAPLDLTLDSVRVTRDLPLPRLDDWLKNLSHPFDLIQSFEPGRGLRLAARAAKPLEDGLWIGSPNPDRKEIPWLTRLPPDCVPASLVDCRAVYCLPVGMTGPGQLLLVKHGVTLAPQELPEPGLAVVCADSLSVDLSEFQVVLNQEYQNVVEQARQRWRELAEVVRPRLPLLHGSHLSRAGAVGLVTFASMVVLGPLALVAGPMAGLAHKRVTTRLDATLREEVEKRL